MPSILEGYGAGNFAATLLSAARSSGGARFGLSNRARQLNEGFLQQSNIGFNTLFGLATGPSLSVTGMQTQIKGLRAGVPLRQMSPRLLQELADQIVKQEAADAKAADTAVAPSSLGNTVNTSA